MRDDFELGQKLFETTIQDQGPGMDKDRQKYMFEILGELFQKQSLQLVKNHSIGVGLSCSKALVNSLNGDLKLLNGSPG